MIPAGMTAEFFGFFSVFNKVGPFFGPMLFGLVNDLTGSSRMAILFLIVFFILGIVVLLTVRGEKGRQEAKAFIDA
jgi:UMF1 family MFS transporter